MPKSSKYPRLTHISESVENPKMPRGDARMAPMDMTDDSGTSEGTWANFHTRKLKMRHGKAGDPFSGLKEVQGGGEK
jgi:hypothetical protein